ncbi:MAG: aminopeptidase P N-terminal domain-containing protein, partial [Deltaproteobacteria bacterium]|nr:aminopeptidase P N-terminal domain-containing protein [Deltaproteobacteria bacterium]
MNTFDNRKQGHDTDAPPNLIEFMLKSWKPVVPRVAPVRNLANFAARRAALSAKFPGDLIVVPNGHLKVRANDTHYAFRACTDFFYLTGNQEPDCVLVLVPEGRAHRAVLFVEPNPGKSDATFFTDRVKGELWEGARLGVGESAKKYGISDTRGLPELEASLRGFVSASQVRV